MRGVESGLWLSGALLLALFFGARGWSDAARERGIREFLVLKQQYAASGTTKSMASRRVSAKSFLAESVRVPNNRMPATVKTSAAPRAVVVPGPEVVAVLRIPRIGLQVPVGVGTDESVLMRGAGLIAGTAAPGSTGNVAIAAHRDSFFRGLKDVAVGDLIELESAHRKDAYRISSLSVVAPSNVAVLAQSGAPALTLVTCFPFHFVGHAPQRFIVRATATEFPAQSPRSSP